MRTDYVEIEADGRRFRLYLDRDEPAVHHIYARHGMSAEDAVVLFFDAEPRWNDQRLRFENRIGRSVLFWAWLHGHDGGTVVVLSCFEVAEEGE